MSSKSSSNVSVLGVLGGGQLGRMILQAAKKVGIEGHVFSDEKDSPACQVADGSTIANYEDRTALKTFAEACGLVTYEFENIPVETVEFIESIREVSPSKTALATFQNRIREKSFLKNNGIPCAKFAIVESLEDFEKGLKEVNFPCVLKTAGLGYDGKGQTKLMSAADAETLKKNWQKNSYVLESFVNLEVEFSVVAARNRDGEFRTWGAIENEHRNHILHISVAPGRINKAHEDEALGIARKIAENINYIGVFCVEFFLTKEGGLLVNEIAPRVHNSGHLTIEASPCSQFEQHVRAVCGLKLGESNITGAYAMLNLLGDLWGRGSPDWEFIEKKYDCKVHLYGKKDPKPGRKMGHLTFTAENPDLAYRKAEEIFIDLNKI
jgi:5-(carboxyamino)imidazole ribonucleotide synthase